LEVNSSGSKRSRTETGTSRTNTAVLRRGVRGSTDSSSRDPYSRPGEILLTHLKVPRRYEQRHLEHNIKVSRPKYLASFTRIKGDSKSWKLGGMPPVYKDPKTGTSLLDEYQDYKEPEDDSTLDFVTNTLRQNSTTKSLLSTFRGFVSFRNNLNKILATPYLRNEYHIHATKTEEGWIRLDVVKTPDPLDDRSRRFMYMGRRFEEICTKHPPDTQQNDDEAGSSMEKHREHCVVVRAKIGDHEMLLGAEIDCIGPRRREEEGEEATRDDGENVWIELKTSVYQESERQRISFQKYKLLKFWIQSYLVGVPLIKCGFRKDHILKEVETFETLKIPRMARDKGGWNGNVCLNFASEILKFIRKNVKDPSKVYRISYSAPWDSIRMYVSPR